MTEWKEYKLETVVGPVETTDRIHDRELFMKGIDYSYYYEEKRNRLEERTNYGIKKTVFNTEIICM